ncbi:FLYWCH zinc finger domain-containing protein [Phthorimaea operculella]|nr:FLYWCH zinc finger domain-containing protein [Phthorimaea operculella]
MAGSIKRDKLPDHACNVFGVQPPSSFHGRNSGLKLMKILLNYEDEDEDGHEYKTDSTSSDEETKMTEEDNKCEENYDNDSLKDGRNSRLKLMKILLNYEDENEDGHEYKTDDSTSSDEETKMTEEDNKCEESDDNNSLKGADSDPADVLHRIATLQESLEKLLETVNPKNPLHSDIVKPISSVQDATTFEQKLTDEAFFADLVSKMTHICGTTGKSIGMNSCYRLIDHFFTRQFLFRDATWTGGANPQCTESEKSTDVLHRIATLQNSLENLLQKVNPNNSNMHTDILKPISRLEEAEELEDKLDDATFFAELVSKMSQICGTSGSCKGLASCYRIVDHFFERQFMCHTSWAGRSRNNEVKIALKMFPNIRRCFYTIVKLSDHSFSENETDEFLRNVSRCQSSVYKVSEVNRCSPSNSNAPEFFGKVIAESTANLSIKTVTSKVHPDKNQEKEINKTYATNPKMQNLNKVYVLEQIATLRKSLGQLLHTTSSSSPKKEQDFVKPISSIEEAMELENKLKDTVFFKKIVFEMTSFPLNPAPTRRGKSRKASHTTSDSCDPDVLDKIATLQNSLEQLLQTVHPTQRIIVRPDIIKPISNLEEARELEDKLKQDDFFEETVTKMAHICGDKARKARRKSKKGDDSLQIETFLNHCNTFCNFMKSVPPPQADFMKPISSFEEAEELEHKLNNTSFFNELVLKMSGICGNSGTAIGMNSCYTLIDYFFERQILCNYSWTGNSKEGDTKKPFKFLFNIRRCFFAICRLSDNTLTVEECDNFFKEWPYFNAISYSEEENITKTRFEEKVRVLYGDRKTAKNFEWTRERIKKAISHIEDFITAPEQNRKRHRVQYYYVKHYDIRQASNGKILVMRPNSRHDSFTKVVPSEEYFDVLFEVHKRTRHGGRDKMIYYLKTLRFVVRRIAKRWASSSIPGLHVQPAEDQERCVPVEVHHGPARDRQEVHSQVADQYALHSIPGERGTFLWTKRGAKHPLLLLSGYTYSYQKKNADGRIFWYCSRRLKGCRASAISVGTKAVTKYPHDHLPTKLPAPKPEPNFGNHFMTGNLTPKQEKIGSHFMSGSVTPKQEKIGSHFMSGTTTPTQEQIGSHFMSGTQPHEDFGSHFITGTTTPRLEEFETHFLSGA